MRHGIAILDPQDARKRGAVYRVRERAVKCAPRGVLRAVSVVVSQLTRIPTVVGAPAALAPEREPAIGRHSPEPRLRNASRLAQERPWAAAAVDSCMLPDFPPCLG